MTRSLSDPDVVLLNRWMGILACLTLDAVLGVLAVSGSGPTFSIQWVIWFVAHPLLIGLASIALWEIPVDHADRDAREVTA